MAFADLYDWSYSVLRREEKRKKPLKSNLYLELTMKTTTKNPVCVTGNVDLFNNIIEEIALHVADVSTIHLPNADQAENGFDEDVLTHFGNTIRSLEEAYNGLIIFARCNAFGITPVADGMPTTDNDTKSAV